MTSANTSYFKHHVFFCLNQRDDPTRACCADKNAKQLQQYAKLRIKEAGLSGEGKVRINQAGCLDRCEEGPCLVIYPEATWYTYIDEADIDEIIESHLKNGKPVRRLAI